MTIASQRMENIAGHASGVHAHDWDRRRAVCSRRIAMDENDDLLRVRFALIGVGFERELAPLEFDRKNGSTDQSAGSFTDVKAPDFIVE